MPFSYSLNLGEQSYRIPIPILILGDDAGIRWNRRGKQKLPWHHHYWNKKESKIHSLIASFLDEINWAYSRDKHKILKPSLANPWKIVGLKRHSISLCFLHTKVMHLKNYLNRRGDLFFPVFNAPSTTPFKKNTFSIQSHELLWLA